MFLQNVERSSRNDLHRRPIFPQDDLVALLIVALKKLGVDMPWFDFRNDDEDEEFIIDSMRNHPLTVI